MDEDKKYVDFGVSPYALPAVLLALSTNGVNDFFVTKEDNDLHIRIEESILDRAVYPRSMLNCMTTPYMPPDGGK